MIIPTEILVVGAGVAGLAAARELQRSGRRVIVLERANGVGGRCATRTLHDQRVDYGVHYLHGGNPHFLSEIEALSAVPGDSPLIPGWPIRVRNPRLACQPDSFTPHQRRFGLVAGVSAFPRALAHGLDVRTRSAVQWLAPAADAVDAVLADGTRFRASRLILALAGPQAVNLLEPLAPRVAGGAELLGRLTALSHIPCLTVVAGYDRTTPEVDFDLAHPLDTTILLSLSHDSTKRRRPEQRVLVLQARSRYSADHLDADPDIWLRDMIWEAGEILGPWAGAPLWTYPHRWSWGRLRPRDPADPGVLPASWLPVEGGGVIGVCGESFAAAGGVEGAFLSGVELARCCPPAADGR